MANKPARKFADVVRVSPKSGARHPASRPSAPQPSRPSSRPTPNSPKLVSKTAKSTSRPISEPKKPASNSPKPVSEPRPPIQPRGHFIDFAPKRPLGATRRVTTGFTSKSTIESTSRLTIEPTPKSTPRPVSRPALERIPEPTPEPAPEPTPEPAPEPTPELAPEPAKRRKRSLINTSGIFDFVRPKASRKRREEPEITPEDLADFAEPSALPNDEPLASTEAEIADFSGLSEDDYSTTNNDFADFSSLTADDHTAIDDDYSEPAPVSSRNQSREAADFAEEIAALDELSVGDGSKIDKELASALELETEDFVDEPKALTIATASTKIVAENTASKSIRDAAREAAVELSGHSELTDDDLNRPIAELIKDDVRDQDFTSGGANYDPLVKDAEKAEEIARKKAAEEEKARKAKARAEAPDGNMYTLGGRSPFLTSVHVEKRPLSNFTGVSNMTSLEKAPTTPVKNTYRAKMKKSLENDAKEIHRQTLIITDSDGGKSRSTALVFAIILTILLGAGVGALIYLVFFQ